MFWMMGGPRNENMTPAKIPVISIAAPNIPAVPEYAGSTILKAYKWFKQKPFNLTPEVGLF